MEGLQRSSSTFRRSGSSGLVWDERFLTEDAEAKKAAADGAEEAGQAPDLRRSRSAGGVGMMMRRAAGGGGGGGDDKKLKVKKKQGQKEGEEQGDDQQVFRTKDVAPDLDPPSPRVSGCILCAIFRGSGSVPAAARRGRTKPRKKQR